MGGAFSGPHISRNHISINNMEIRRKEQYGGMDFNIGTGPTRGRNHPTGSNNTGHTQGAPSGSWNGFQNNHNWEEQQQQPKPPNEDRTWGTGGQTRHSGREFSFSNLGQAFQQGHIGQGTNQWRASHRNGDGTGQPQEGTREAQGNGFGLGWSQETAGRVLPQKSELSRFMQTEFPNIGHRLLEKIRKMDTTAQQAAENSPLWRNFYTNMSLLSEDIRKEKSVDQRHTMAFPEWV